jgi:hypothetical protein
MNFGFSCFKKLFCCIPQIYSFGRNPALGHFEADDDNFTRCDPPLSGTVFPRIDRQSDWVSVCAGPNRSYGIMSDGSLWAWGEAERGDGSYNVGSPNAERFSGFPVLVDSGPWLKVSASATHTVGIKQDGTMWQWGDVLPRKGSGATLRAKLKTSVASAQIEYGGKYTRNPTSVEIKTVNYAGGSMWVDATSPPGSGATASFEMAYPLIRDGVPWPPYIVSVQNGGAGYKSTPTVTLTDGKITAKDYLVSPLMSFFVTTVTVKDGGFGYTVAPAVTMTASRFQSIGQTQPASAVVSKMGCILTGVTIESGGSGYVSPPDVFLNGEFRPDVDAIVSGGQVVFVQLPTNVIKFDEPSVAITFAGGGGQGATASTRSRLNHVVEVTVTSQGSNYAAPPAVTFTPAAGSGGAGASASANVSGSVTGLNIPDYSNENTEFTSPPTLTITGECDTPAQVTYLSIGYVKSVKIEQGGQNYTQANKNYGTAATNPRVRAIFTRHPEDAITSSQGTSDASVACILSPAPIDSIEVVNPGAGYSTELKGELKNVSTSIGYPRGVPDGYTARLVAGPKTVMLGPNGTIGTTSGWPYRPYLYVDYPGYYLNQVRDYSADFDGPPYPKIDLDVAIKTLSIDGFGAKARAVIQTTGQVQSAYVISGGEGYIEEPYCEVAANLLWPRAIGGDKTWKDIAAGDGGGYYVYGQSFGSYSVAIDNAGLLYWWGDIPLEDSVFGSGSRIRPFSYSPVLVGNGLVVAPGTPAFEVLYPPQDYSGTSGYGITPPDGPGSLARIGSVSLYGNQTTWTMQPLGTGYTSAPQWFVLHGPGACTSVVIHEGAILAINESNELWWINANTIEAGDSVDNYTSPATLVSVLDGVRTVSQGDPAPIEPGASYFLRNTGSGYSNPKAVLVNVKYHWRIIKTTLSPSGSTQEIDSSGDVVYSVPLEYVAGPGLLVFSLTEKSITSPGTITITPPPGPATGVPPVPPTEGNTSFFAEGFVSYCGDLVIVDDGGSGSGASYVRRPMKVVHPGPGQGRVGIGTTWSSVTSANKGVLTSGTLMRDAMGAIPFQQVQQGVSVTGIGGGLFVRDDQSAWSISNTQNCPPVVVGDVELTVDDHGEGYTEPVVIRTTDQPAGVAKVSANFNAKVVAVGVEFPGRGYNTPPTITVAGAQATATIVGEVSEVSVTAQGSGYRLPPRVIFSQPGFSATGVASLTPSGGVASVVVTSGGMYRSAPTVSFEPIPEVSLVSVTSPGEGYSSPPDVVFAGGMGGSGATAKSKINGRVTEVNVVFGGRYKSPPVVEFLTHFSDQTGNGAAGVAVLDENGRISSIELTNNGSMYQTSPSVKITGGNGQGANAYAVISGPVHSVEITSGGQKYYEAPKVFFVGGGGTSAEATASTQAYGQGAAGTSRINGEVWFCTVAPGAGGGLTETPTVTVTGGDNKAIDDANARLSEGQITQSQRDAIVEQYQARCQARIAGEISSMSVQEPGNSYGQQRDLWNGVVGRGFRILGGDSQGVYASRSYSDSYYNVDYQNNETYGLLESTYIQPLNWDLYGTQAGLATINTSGGISSVPIPADHGGVPLLFTAPPLVAFENTVAIRARTRARVCCYAARSDEPALSVSTYYGFGYDTTCTNQTISEFRRSPNYQNGAGFDTTWNERLSGHVFLKGGGIGFNAPFTADRFEAAPSVLVEGVTGSGAVVQLSLDETGKIIVGTQGVTPGSGYGSFTRGIFVGGKLKVTPTAAVAVVDDGRVVAVDVTQQGSGYSRTPTVVIHGGGGSGAVAEAVLDTAFGRNRKVVGIRVISGGSGYTSAPTVSIVSENKRYSDEVSPISTGCFLLAAGTTIEHVEMPNAEVWRSFFAIPRMLYGRANAIFPFEIFFDSGRLDEVYLDSSIARYLSNQCFLKRLPAFCGVTVSGKCKRPANVIMTRPAWSNVIDSVEQIGQGAATFRGFMVRDTTQ